ncbi:g6737 [Coccomyxa viridis]|uniref:G6737 protein n=1 Tax=Coccomyxa viridis TaxID=1274662 RepID=A0ABP1FYK3_9CHLO
MIQAGSSTKVSTADFDVPDGSRSCQHFLQKPSCRASAGWQRTKRRQTALNICSSLHRNGHEAGCRLAGCGSSVPEAVLTNADLEKLVETNDEWIASRTGIRRRHVMAEGESLSQHAAAASQRALEMAGVAAEEVDLIILATSSPDDLFGSACQVQAMIGAKRAMAFDLTAACSGFVVGLITAAQFIRTGQYRNIIIIGADALSRYVDWRDRGTCILFGDGCGAVVMTAQEGSCSLLGSSMCSDGLGQKHLKALYCGEGMKPLHDSQASAKGSFDNIFMNGQEVFKFAVRAVPLVVEQALKDADMHKDAIDFLVLHQANQRILDSAAQRLGVPSERVVSNLAEYGNTSAASIPLALDEAVRGNVISDGNVLALAGFGAGLTWASAIMRWR